MREALVAGGALVLGLGIMPLLIELAGTSTLGPYEHGGMGQLYGSIFRTLPSGSPASWTVVLGPYGLYLLWKVLRAWWRIGAR